MTKTVIKRLKLEKNEVLCIVWDDVLTEANWHNRTELNKIGTVEIKTLGFFDGVRHDKIIVKHNLDWQGDEGDFTAIPIRSVKRIRRLKIK